MIEGLEDANVDVRIAALRLLRQQNPAILAQHAAAVIARLEDSEPDVQAEALDTLGKLEPATLAQYADAVIARLEDEDNSVQAEALDTLGNLEPATLAQYADSLIVKLDNVYVRGAATLALRSLPRAVTRPGDFFDDRSVRSRLVGRLAWHRCRLRLRVKGLALYWYALPYRPSGPGHARDIDAWDQMVEDSKREPTTEGAREGGGKKKQKKDKKRKK